MDVVFLLVLVAIIGAGGYYVSQRPTVTAQEQDRINRS